MASNVDTLQPLLGNLRPLSSGYADASRGARLYYELYGHPDNGSRTIVVLNGACSKIPFWSYVIQRMVRLGYRVLLHEARGIGRSTCRRGRQTSKLLARDCLVVVDTVLGPDSQFYLLGASFGGMIGQELIYHLVTTRKQSRLQAAFLLATFAGNRWRTPPLRRARHVRRTVLPQMSYKDQEDFEARFPPSIELMFSQGWLDGPAAVPRARVSKPLNPQQEGKPELQQQQQAQQQQEEHPQADDQDKEQAGPQAPAQQPVTRRQVIRELWFGHWRQMAALQETEMEGVLWHMTAHVSHFLGPRRATAIRSARLKIGVGLCTGDLVHTPPEQRHLAALLGAEVYELHVLSPNFRCVALDLPGHGSAPEPRGPFSAEDLVGAVLDFVASRDIRDCYCFGHSLGGSMAAMVEMERPGTFRAMFLFEPVVTPFPKRSPSDQPAPSQAPAAATAPPELLPRAPGAGEGGRSLSPSLPAAARQPAKSPANLLARMARKRQPSFPSLEAAKASLGSKPPFNTFHPQALDAYLTCGGLKPPAPSASSGAPHFGSSGNGGCGGAWTLACAPESEARVYEALDPPPWRPWHRLAGGTLSADGTTCGGGASAGDHQHKGGGGCVGGNEDTIRRDSSRHGGSTHVRCQGVSACGDGSGATEGGAASGRCRLAVAAGKEGAGVHSHLAIFAAQLAEVVPGAQLFRFPALQHLGPMEDPAAVATAAHKFFLAPESSNGSSSSSNGGSNGSGYSNTGLAACPAVPAAASGRSPGPMAPQAPQQWEERPLAELRSRL